jgi:ribosomal-protein-alanine N-acetyltransferase
VVPDDAGPPVGAPRGGLPAGVRPARTDDLPALLALQAASLPDPEPEFLRTSVHTGLALVAVDPLAEDPVGYVLHTSDDRAAYVAELAVAPAYRRRGHGRRLLAGVAAAHPDRERLRLTTRVDNEAARAFYERAGFREVRQLPDHYETENGSTDGVLLVRDL